MPTPPVAVGIHVLRGLAAERTLLVLATMSHGTCGAALGSLDGTHDTLTEVDPAVAASCRFAQNPQTLQALDG